MKTKVILKYVVSYCSLKLMVLTFWTESLQLQMSVLHQSISIFKVVLSSLSDGWARYKEKVPDPN